VDQRLHDALVVVGEVPEHCAWFRIADSESLEHALRELEEISMQMSVIVTRKAPNPLAPEEPHIDRQGLPEFVAVSVSAQTVTVWSSEAHHVLGPLVATYRRGAFRAHMHHYPERVDLTLEDKQDGRIYMTGSWALFNDECLHTARAAVAMATGPAY
jgi:hypothetical protein